MAKLSLFFHRVGTCLGRFWGGVEILANVVCSLTFCLLRWGYSGLLEVVRGVDWISWIRDEYDNDNHSRTDRNKLITAGSSLTVNVSYQLLFWHSVPRCSYKIAPQNSHKGVKGWLVRRTHLLHFHVIDGCISGRFTASLGQRLTILYKSWRRWIFEFNILRTPRKRDSLNNTFLSSYKWSLGCHISRSISPTVSRWFHVDSRRCFRRGANENAASTTPFVLFMFW